MRSGGAGIVREALSVRAIPRSYGGASGQPSVRRGPKVQGWRPIAGGGRGLSLGRTPLITRNGCPAPWISAQRTTPMALDASTLIGAPELAAANVNPSGFGKR